MVEDEDPVCEVNALLLESLGYRVLQVSDADCIKILFQSGYPDDIVVCHGILQTEVPFLQKPFSIDTLAKKIRNLCDQK
jgi:DNA-binding response OmpR family regulator